MSRAKIAGRGASTFWSQYRRSGLGMVGLVIFLSFLAIAVLAPLISRYDPNNDRYLADAMAMPGWVSLFGKKDVNPTIKGFVSGPDMTTALEDGVSSKAADGGIDVYASPSASSGSFEYTYPVRYDYAAPDTFTITMEVLGPQTTGVQVQASLDFVSPDGESRTLWGSMLFGRPSFGAAPKYKVVSIDSRDMMLRMKLGMDAFSNLAQLLFSSKGDYRLVLKGTYMGSGSDETPILSVRGITYEILGEKHGLLGTDHLGRDLWSQIAYGSRVSLIIGISASLIAVIVGTVVGIVAGYVGGFLDEILMRVADVMLSIPTLPILIVLSALIGKSIWNIVILVSIFAWMGIARIVRSQTLTLKSRSFVEAARAAGAGKWYVMTYHILPNVLPMVFASMVLLIPGAIVTEATLSFLGFGDPTVATWGSMLYNARGHGAFSSLAWWWIVPPGMSITLLSLSFVFIGNTVDSILNPRHRER